MIKQRFNLHTHTWRCGHADGLDYMYVEKAIEAGFQMLGFSEHIQYRKDNGKYGRIDFEQFQYYFSDIRALKKAYKDRITILCGLEAAYVYEEMQDLLELSEMSDYVLLGQHQGGLVERKYCLKCDDRDVLHYAADIESGLETQLYTAIAHPDFFMNTRNTWSSQCTEAAERICLAAKKHSVPLELNIKGSLSEKTMIDGDLTVHYPYRRFWEIAAKVGNDIIYGWDAHHPDDLLCQTNEVDKIIEGLDLSRVNDSYIHLLVAHSKE